MCETKLIVLTVEAEGRARRVTVLALGYFPFSWLKGGSCVVVTGRDYSYYIINGTCDTFNVNV